ncbi:hypothetical protein [Sphingobacterium humi]|uniref:Glycosyltransferase RgtA/B/C/D-like domain-containing protein n=1 Tax=Sphingobacterium humi TaxID=1796905 RepID=A0A6N8L1N6_9SPHI|nr:hypothetical protein [Sphingobacterium humi]MVZ63645.1 hypothetical protein [Sphingobacterium humi]
MKIQSVWIGSISIPYIYLSLRKFLLQSVAYKAALLFSLFSHVVIYSVVFNRDPHIYLVFVLASYLLVHFDTKKFVFIKLFGLMLLAMGFRLEHGLFFSVFIIGYFYLKATKNKSLLLVLFAVLPVFFAIFSPSFLDKYGDNSEAYQNQIDRVERTSFSAGAALSKLPPGLKQIAMGINSQIASAVPFWRGWKPEPNDPNFRRFPVPGYFTSWRFMEGVAGVFWFFVWGIVVAGFVRGVHKFVPQEIKIPFYIGVLLILVASSSINIRRIYCVYPAIYIYATYIYVLLPPFFRNQAIRYSAITLVAFYCIYLSLKGF